jgi:hypothetical protein
LLSRREALVALAVVTAAWLVVASLSDWLLLRKQYWMDEMCCTVFALRDASNPIELLGYVKRYDVAPPLLHLLAWPFAKIAGYAPAVLHTLTLVSAVIAIWVLYLALRRRFGRAASAGAVIGIASHTLLLHHAFDARFYAPWLMFAVLYAWALGLDHDRPSRRRDLLIGVFAICLCSIQWLGITSLFLLAAGAVASHGSRWRAALRLVAPSAAGLVVFAALLPMMLTQGRAGGGALLWVPALSASQLLQMAQLFLLRLPLVIAVILLLSDRAMPARFRHVGPRTSLVDVLREPGLAAMLATILMPLVLVAVSIVVAPVMVPRYAVVSLLAAAPVIALGLQVIGRVGYGVVVAVFAAWVIGFVDKELRYAQYTDALTAEHRKQFDEVRTRFPAIPIVFHSYFTLYPVDGMSRQQSVARVMDLPDSTIASLYPDVSQSEDKRRMTVNRDAVRLHQQIFQFPRTVSQAQMDSMPRFFLFSTDDDLPFGHQNAITLGGRLFPRHRAQRLSGIITLFDRVGTRQR